MIIARSPLRITLGGGGTDLPSYYNEHEGFLIAAAIDKYVINPIESGSSVAKIDLKPTITNKKAAPPYTKAVRALISDLNLKFILFLKG